MLHTSTAILTSISRTLARIEALLWGMQRRGRKGKQLNLFFWCVFFRRYWLQHYGTVKFGWVVYRNKRRPGQIPEKLMPQTGLNVHQYQAVSSWDPRRCCLVGIYKILSTDTRYLFRSRKLSFPHRSFFISGIGWKKASFIQYTKRKHRRWRKILFGINPPN